MRRVIRFVAGCAALVIACASSVGAQSIGGSCTTIGKNRFVYDAMREFYLWNTALPSVNTASFSSPEALLERLRHRPLDEYFSYIGDKAAEDAYYSDSQYIGFGFASGYDGLGLRVTEVFPDSPASDVGLARGDRIVTIGGNSVVALAKAGTLNAALGDAVEGFRMSVRFDRPDGTHADAVLVKRAVTIPTVSILNLYEVEGRRVGYLYFRNFVGPSEAALDEAFTALRGVEVTDLVLDLRYNGGGLARVAEQLASLIGGARTDGQVFTEYVHNERNAWRNEAIRFAARPQSLSLDRVVVITTRATASASELVINGLAPFVQVVTVGEPTYGKPVGMYGLPFCDKVLYPVAFSLRNADGQGDYFAGIPAACPAIDDIDHQLGDAQEASLREALHVVTSGTCSAPPLQPDAQPARRRASVRQDEVLPRRGLERLIGAY